MRSVPERRFAQSANWAGVQAGSPGSAPTSHWARQRVKRKKAVSSCDLAISDTVLRWLAGAIRDGATPEAMVLRTRFQQVSGALMAKSQEDTAFFRFTRCLAHCEVGNDPGDPAWTSERFGEWLAGRSGRDLALTSSHDTKRAEDARMRLVAMTHLPEAFATVLAASDGVPGAAATPPSLRWYIVQSLLAVWEDGRGDIAGRLALHVEKALREAREVTHWAFPQPAPESRAEDFARALALDWAAGLPKGAAALIERGEALSLAQVALKMVMPGIPDLYQGAEGPLFHLTDPDNREGTDWPRPLPPGESLAARKGRLTRALLALRAARPDAFEGAARVEAGDGAWRLVREGASGLITLAIAVPGAPAGAPLPGSVWPKGHGDGGGLAVDWAPARAARAAE